MFEHHTALKTFVWLQGSMTSLMRTESGAIREMFVALLALENILKRMYLHVPRDSHLKLKLSTTQGTAVRFI
jgi:hypothetical protein